MRRLPRQQRAGQAMAETLVACLALVALFLCIPMIGKLWDVKHVGLAAARYGAWERTAWFAPAAGLEGAVKADETIDAEIRKRVLRGPRGQEHVWHDHAGSPLLALPSYEASEETTPALVAQAGRPLRLTPDGYFHADVSLGLHAPAYPPEMADGPLEAATHGAILTREWSSSGSQLTWERARRLVLRLPFVPPGARLFEFFFPDFWGTTRCNRHRGPPGPRGGLCIGFVDPEPVPPDREPEEEEEP